MNSGCSPPNSNFHGDTRGGVKAFTRMESDTLQADSQISDYPALLHLLPLFEKANAFESSRRDREMSGGEDVLISFFGKSGRGRYHFGVAKGGHSQGRPGITFDTVSFSSFGHRRLLVSKPRDKGRGWSAQRCSACSSTHFNRELKSRVWGAKKKSFVFIFSPSSKQLQM